MDNTKIKEFLFKDKEYVDSRIADGIEKYRKGDAKIKFLDKSGKEIDGVSFTAEQISHDFLFGGNLFMLDEIADKSKNELYKEYFKDIFNLATLPFYWKDLEPEKGKPRYSADSPKVYRRPAPDLCLDWCEKNGVTPKAHCVVYEGWQPTWLPDDIDEIKALYEKRMGELRDRYSKRIHSWEVINETLCYCPSPFANAPDYTEWSLDKCAEYFSENELIINEYSRNIFDALDTTLIRSPYVNYLKYLSAIGKRFDAIGIQYHMFFGIEEYMKMAEHRYDLKRMYDILDIYNSEFNKPLQITEITIPCYSKEAEDEETQADILERLYKVWFSVPNMESIIYWNLVDGYAAFAPEGSEEGENFFHGGLIRYDFTKKPAYYRLQNLIKNEWHTSVSGQGNTNFRGFYGKYNVTATYNGETTKTQIHIKKEKENNFVITL